MQKVIIINLNGHPFHVEEAGYDALREYLARAERDLEGNPDRAEIMADLEQAIADKCGAFLGPHKSVVTAAEVDRIVAEMGPIDAAARPSAGDGAGAEGKQAAGTPPPKRLYRIPGGAMIGGICTGLAAYFSIDVVIVRFGVVVIALATQGLGILAYIVMMFVVPEANTPEERAASGAMPFNAKDVVDRAKAEYAKGTRRLRRHWRQHRRHWRREQAAAAAPFAYGPPRTAAVLSPVFGLVHLALFLTLAAMLISLVNTEAILGWELTPDMPVWAGVLILLVLYQIVVAPIRAAERWAQGPSGTLAFWNAIIWLVGLTFVIWIASNHIPEIREFLQRLPDVFRDFTDEMRDLVSR